MPFGIDDVIMGVGALSGLLGGKGGGGAQKKNADAYSAQAGQLLQMLMQMATQQQQRGQSYNPAYQQLLQGLAGQAGYDMTFDAPSGGGGPHLGQPAIGAGNAMPSAGGLKLNAGVLGPHGINAGAVMNQTQPRPMAPAPNGGVPGTPAPNMPHLFKRPDNGLDTQSRNQMAQYNSALDAYRRSATTGIKAGQAQGIHNKFGQQVLDRKLAESRAGAQREVYGDQQNRQQQALMMLLQQIQGERNDGDQAFNNLSGVASGLAGLSGQQASLGLQYNQQANQGQQQMEDSLALIFADLFGKRKPKTGNSLPGGTALNNDPYMAL